MPLTLVDSFLYPGHSVKRMHGSPNRTGSELMGSLTAAVERRGIDVLTDGTDVHLVLVDLTSTGLDGQTGEDRLDQVGITVNRNAIPFDERPPMNPSGLRIGTPALSTRGFQPEDMTEIASIISTALGSGFESQRDSLAARSQALMDKYPLYPGLG